MRIFVFLLLSSLLPAVTWAQSGDYLIVEVDAAAGTFTGKDSQMGHKFRVRAGSEITINARQAAFTEIVVGMKAKVTSADPGVATKIVATGTRTSPVTTVAVTAATTSPGAMVPSAQAKNPQPNYFGTEAPNTGPDVASGVASGTSGSDAPSTALPSSPEALTDFLASSVWKTPDGHGQIEFAKDGPAVVDHGRVNPKWWCVDGRTFHLWNNRTIGKLDPMGTFFEIKYQDGGKRQIYTKTAR